MLKLGAPLSLLGAVIIINNRLNSVPITDELYNFFIFLLVCEVISLVSFIWMTGMAKIRYLLPGIVIFMIGIINSAIVISSSRGSQVTEMMYNVSIAYVVVYFLALGLDSYNYRKLHMQLENMVYPSSYRY